MQNKPVTEQQLLDMVATLKEKVDALNAAGVDQKPKVSLVRPIGSAFRYLFVDTYKTMAKRAYPLIKSGLRYGVALAVPAAIGYVGYINSSSVSLERLNRAWTVLVGSDQGNSQLVDENSASDAVPVSTDTKPTAPDHSVTSTGLMETASK